MSETIIELAGVRFAYGETPVLEDIDLAVRAGEIYGLVGADGAGKTTLLRLAVGQLRPFSGRVRLLGGDPAAPELREQLAYMPQGFGLYPDLSVAENLDFFADLHGLERADADRRITELLARTGLHGFEGRRAHRLSGGMMQKLALACALVSAPRAMCLDEPTTGVDPVSRRAFWSLLDGVRAEGVAILYATANMDEAERCDRVAFLEAGRFLRTGTPEALAAVPDALLVSVHGEGARAARSALRATQGVTAVLPVGSRLHVWLEAGWTLAAFRAHLASVDEALEVERIHATLHDAVLRELTLHRAGEPQWSTSS
ncbi:MAG: ABC transporter ATP-binding protein [Gammaproteobacteria bacterium]|nr:ABC transporter ATP-binding protein [Gammaproteobacteria bacterium]